MACMWVTGWPSWNGKKGAIVSKRINPEERIVEYFESASSDAAQATLNMIKAILKRKNGKENEPVKRAVGASS
jgi:hypothetical protein